jgi:hypothetical protein
LMSSGGASLRVNAVSTIGNRGGTCSTLVVVDRGLFGVIVIVIKCIGCFGENVNEREQRELQDEAVDLI